MNPEATCCGVPSVVERSTIAVTLSRAAKGLAIAPPRARSKVARDSNMSMVRPRRSENYGPIWFCTQKEKTLLLSSHAQRVLI